MKRVLSFLNKLVLFVNLIFVMVTTIALLVPYVPVTYMPTLSTVSLVIPILVCIHVVFVIFWLFRKKRFWLWSAVTLVVWYVILGPFYQISGNQENQEQETLSIMSYNVRSFNKYGWIESSTIDEDIISLIKGQDPDILCFQEFSMIKKKKFSNYPYNYETPPGTDKSFQIFFSKYPIVNGGTLDFPSSSNNGLYMDVVYHGDTIRIYNVHLQSFRIIPEIDAIKNQKSSKLLAKSEGVMLKQYEQAMLIQENMHQNHLKKIVVGDFNNTQYSNIYRTIKGDLQDTFLEKGKGFGKTYNLLGFPLRIDYIMADEDFEVISHENFNEKLSDHYPIMANLRVKSDK